MSSLRDITVISRLANAFTDLVRDALTVQELIHLRVRNRAYSGSSRCASREYLDADGRMSVAFLGVLGRPRDLSNRVDTDLCATAWLVAKNTDFTRSPVLTETARGVPAYTYFIRGMVIENPYRTECGRYHANPMKDYGLTADESLCLLQANVTARLFLDR